MFIDMIENGEHFPYIEMLLKMVVFSSCITLAIVAHSFGNEVSKMQFIHIRFYKGPEVIKFWRAIIRESKQM